MMNFPGLRSHAIGLAVMLSSLSVASAAEPPEFIKNDRQPASGQGLVVTPQSSQPHVGDAGVRMRTHTRLFVPAQRLNPDSSPFTGYFFETPASVACLYGLAAKTTGCVPGTATANATGGSKVIAIVDAYDYPQAASDLATFSTQFGLPTASFSTVYATGRKPSQDYTGGWEMEEALDIEWAHAMAPGAKIILVEAASDSNSDLLKAVDVASTLVAQAGGGEVSMSWGGDEFSGEKSYDTHFATANVVYLAAAGDEPGVGWPATSANVLAAGGTSVQRNPVTGVFISETTWQDGSGGPSAFIARPAFQASVASAVGTTRGIPDLSAVANPTTGVWIYDSFPYEGSAVGWTPIGGTSVATPLLAGVINASGKFSASTAAELTTIYTNAATTGAFNAITKGSCGPYVGYSAGGTWSDCVGLGSPTGKTKQ